jgi:hypothetical protein
MILSSSQFFVQLAMVLCIVIYLSFYLVGIYRGKVKPTFATWLFLALATILSLITDYRETGAAGLLANSFNLVDTIAVLFIFIIVLFLKDSRRAFTSFEKGCLAAVIVIFILWLLSGQNVLAHLAIQAILVIAYLPMLVKLWYATENTESLGTWFFDFSASCFGLIEPLRAMAFLPLVYVIRSIISTLVTVILILRIPRKQGSN